MCNLSDLIEEKGIEKGKKEGFDEKTRQIVRNMLKRGMTDEDVIALAECRRELVEEIKKEI